MTEQAPPTPWRFDGHGVNDAEGQRIATLTQSLKWREFSPSLGGTLAASSELLAALEDLVTAHDKGYDLPWGTARNAIARAKETL